MIKKTLWAILASITIIACTSEQGIPAGKNFSLVTEITDADTIYIAKINPEAREYLDTLSLVNGKATYYGVVENSDFYATVLPNGDIINIFVEPGDEIVITGTADRFSAEATLVGSEVSKEIRDLDTYFHATLHKRDSIFQLARTVEKERYKEVQQSFDRLSIDHRLYLENFINQNVGSPSTIFAIYNVINQTPAFDLFQDYEWFKKVGDSLEVRYPNLSHTGFFNKLLKQANAPDFTLPDREGNYVNLSDFKGKWVLLDFWASWCKPCRVQSPLLKELDAEFEDLEIISVTIDGGSRQKTPREDWLKAIKEDGIGGWTHLGDMQGANSIVTRLYGFKSIPFMVVVNPEGRIVAKNLRGGNLRLFLSSRLNK